VDDAAQHAPIVNAARARLVLRKMRFDRGPLRVTQPKPIRHASSSDVSEFESLFDEKSKS
jgi:hypothetical protein